jgi:poly-gamma-glutamate capsule biosynthesis protein CapA/YwtB (metallophosphatase superfamily)
MSLEKQITERQLVDSNNARSIKIRAVGDILMIAGAGEALTANGISYPFEHVTEYIQSADLAFANLEMPICTDPKRKPSIPDVCPDFFSPPQIVDVLKQTGFDVINLANNHTMDWGIGGLRETLASLHAVGLQTIGAGENLKDARRPAIFEKKKLKIGFLGYSELGVWIATNSQPGVAPINRQMILEDIQELRSSVDLLVISLHTGIIYSDFPSPEDRQLAHEIIDSGADLILGHGPHVLQGIEIYHDRAIIYSLGNFMIDLSSGNVENKVMLQEHLESIIVNVNLHPNTLPVVDCFPILINNKFQVVPADHETDSRIRTRIEKTSKNLDNLSGLTLWEQAGSRIVEHQMSVIAFQMKNVSLLYVIKRLKKVRLRHFHLLLGYMVSKIRKFVGHQAVEE